MQWVCAPAVCAVLLGITCARAQSSSLAAAATKPQVYDVVSIKPNKTGSGHVSVHTNDGNYDASNVSLALLIESAYGYKQDQIVGLEGPISSASFDIRAKVLEPNVKALGSLTREERGRMLQPILADRFGLRFHLETRVLPVYELIVAKGGIKLSQTSAVDKGEGDGKSFHGVSSGSESMHTSRTTAEIIGHDLPLSVLVSDLSAQLRRSVIDKTGLTGKYDIWLKWTPDDLSASPDKSADNGAVTSADPDLFTALQEQLGLKLQGSKDPVQVLVIDSVTMPTED